MIKRTIYVDADACPVKEEVLQAAKKFEIPVVMVIDTSHEHNDGYSQVVTVDKANDSVDFAILNRMTEGDVVVTQDYGLASMALAKKGLAINQNGFLYTHDNIDKLLFERHLNKKARRSGNKTPNPKKRVKEDDLKFLVCFEKLISIIE